MIDMGSVDRLIADIEKAFSEGPPNGFLLGWQRDRFFPSLQSSFRDCAVTNDTDYNYSYCNSFEIEPDPSGKEGNLVITLKMSHVADVYSVHVTKYSRDKRRGNVVPCGVDPIVSELCERVHQFAADKGFQEIDERLTDMKIPGVDLELAEEATVGKCLFDDFE